MNKQFTLFEQTVSKESLHTSVLAQKHDMGIPASAKSVEKTPFGQSGDIVHERENSRESENHLNENRKHFAKSCEKVFNLLMEGKRLTVRDAIVNHGISSLPRRCLDLKQAGVAISDEWSNDEPAFKTWYMSATDIYANKDK